MFGLSPPSVAIRVAISMGIAAVQPVSAQGSGPVIDAVTMREDLQRYEVVYPEFHFHDPTGSVRFIHREIVDTNAPRTLQARDGVVNISSAQQVKGATYVGGWKCGPESYYVTLQAYVLNLAGVKSNVVRYTIHCNGG